MKRLLAATLLLSVSACAWPNYGAGGMDDVYDYPRVSELPLYNPEYLDPEPEKRQFVAEMLDETKVIIADLKDVYGGHLPARVRIIEVQWDRAARAYKGDMLDDALVDLSELHRLIDVLNSQPVRTNPRPANVSA